jgi:peptide/nickel transport system substrate-binding protein
MNGLARSDARRSRARGAATTTATGTRTRRRWRFLAAVVALALLGAACGGDDDDEAAPDAAADTDDGQSGGGDDDGECTEERAGGELNFGAFFMTTGFDPTISTGSGTTGSIELGAVYDMLVRWNPETREFEPWLAESIEPDEDFSQWTLTLREGVTFGNGDPLTAEAVRWNIARHQDPANASTMFVDLLAVTGMEAVDDRTLVFTLAEPWGSFPFVLGDMAGLIVNPAVVEQMGRDAFHVDPTAGAGAGPYVVERFAPGEEIVLRAKDDYWGGPVCIDTIRVTDIPTPQATFDALELGEIDLMMERDAQVIDQIRDAELEHFSELNAIGGMIMTNTGLNDPETADVRIRQAMAAAVDPEVMDERVNGGVGKPTSCVIPPESPVAPDTACPEYDPDRARELVEEAKADGWDGTLELLVADINPEPAITIEGLLEAVGMQVDVGVIPLGDQIQRMYITGNYTAGISGTSMHDGSPIVSLNRWWGPTNTYTGYRDPDFAPALQRVRAASNDEELEEALADVQEVWTETVPAVVYSAVEQVVAWNDNVHGLVQTHSGVVLFSDAYVD